MKALKLLIQNFCLIALLSCSTLNKTMIYSAIGVGTIAAFAGAGLSPNKESRMTNAVVFGSLGAAGGAMLGKFFFNENPENQKMPSMIIEDKKEFTKNLEFIPSGTMGITTPITINATPVKKYELPSAPMPEELKGMAKKQYAIEYQLDGKIIQQGNSSFYIKPTTVIEYKVE